MDRHSLPWQHLLRMRLAGLVGCLCLLALALSCARLPSQDTNQAPEILAITATPSTLNAASEILFSAQTRDLDGDSLTASWQINRGSFLAQYPDSARWLSPDSTTYARLIYTIEDSHGNLAADTLYFWVENRTPHFTELGQDSPIALNGNTLKLWAHAVDPDSQSVVLAWNSPWGTLSSTMGDTVRWTAPDTTLNAWIAVSATDSWGNSASDTLEVRVYSEIGCVWILDAGAGRVVKLSAEGDPLLEIPGLNEPGDIGLDSENRRLWVSELNPPALKAFDLQGTQLLDLAETFGRPSRIQVWPRTGSVYVMDEDSARISEVRFNGEPGERVLDGLDRPGAMAIHQRTGMLWIADAGSNQVWQVPETYSGAVSAADSLTGVRAHNGFLYPYDLSVEDSTGACWVVDKNAARLYRFLADGLDSLTVSGFDNPVAVSAGHSEGLAWVLDRGLNGRAIRLFFDLQQTQHDNIRYPKALAANRLDASCWVLDAERNQVLKINSLGALAGSWSDFTFPTRLVINMGY
ncbi:MAG: hypothetical protein H6678_11125 [Candidatus Delongbacteria bacterium]|nr:hypothetical protein [Candidatus Delongbacteria bacterium]